MNKNKLAARFGVMNVISVLLILAVMSVICGLIIQNLISTVSQDYARLFTIDSVDKLSSELSTEIASVRGITENEHIVAWFEDESNLEKKALAYQVLMVYSNILQIDSLYFVIYDSLNEYDVMPGTPLTQVEPFNVIDRLEPYDKWFFNTVQSNLPFNLNIDVCKRTNITRLWINHQVVSENGLVIGVVCSALALDELFEELYGNHDSANVRKFIADSSGIIQLDSANPGLKRITVENPMLQEETSILSISSDNRELIDAINRIQRNSGLFNGRRIDPEVFSLSRGDYHYAAIAPIPGTNWITVTFYNSNALFNLTNILPLIIAVILAFVAFISANAVLIRRLVLNPLNALTHSIRVGADGVHHSERIYGVERDDEIGALALELRQSWREVEQRDNLLRTVNQAAEILLTVHDEDAEFEIDLYTSMRQMAKTVDADRAYIWKNSIHRSRMGDDIRGTQLYEWLREGAPPQEDEFIQNISYRDNLPDWLEILSRGECVNGKTRDMRPETQKFLDGTGVTAVFVVPVFLKNEFWGFVGFDNCRNERTMSENEASILRSGCLLIGNAFLRFDTFRNLQDTTFELELQTSMMRALFDSIPDLIFVKDMNLRFTQVNAAFMKHFACDESIIGKTDAEGLGVPIELAERFNEVDRRVINEGVINIEEEYVAAADGRVPYFETAKVPLTIDGVPVGILGIARDITKRKEAQEMIIAASRSKSAFLANMSHEIRTPLNSIVGFSELAITPELDARTKDYLEKITQNSQWLLQIINDILDISKIESGKLELEVIPFDLHDIFAACRTLIMPKTIEKGLSLYFYAEPSVGKVLCGDPTRLKQILINLLSNAVKFTNSGMIKMQSSIRNIGEDSVVVHFEIKDSGIGMSREQIDKIFEPFTQAESGTTRKYGGTGLGLAITKNIVEMFGAKLTVESTPGVGSKFSFTIEFDAVNDDESGGVITRAVQDVVEKPYFTDCEILLCEDNLMNQQVISEHLSRVGLRTTIAENGRIGVEFVENRIKSGEKPFDIIFMDIHMPEMDGIEAAAKILELKREHGVNTPVIAMTANIMSNDKELYDDIGMNDCVGKPFTSQELWHCLLKYLKPTTPPSSRAVAGLSDNELRQQLISRFVETNTGKFAEIEAAIRGKDLKLAHRLAHTLKSNAAQLNKKLLQKAAQVVEHSLAKGENNTTPEQMTTLKAELNAALAEFNAFVIKPKPQEKSKKSDLSALRALVETLEPLLEDGDPESCNYIEQLQQITGCEEMVKLIEEFEFKAALEELRKLTVSSQAGLF
ncbi:MAG: ATP-binding protein [Oscillospiraceae bacterium]|nr:ATP-binding protein [Oscillospiraceae bacterium]